ncbi:MAG: hypothetical protein M0Q91_17435 [Methanoregula sp.]|jgi:hypothetical protein|nr:hypothetical protein [Methanoregula sp.]
MVRERERPEREKRGVNNATFIGTKSGTKVIVVGKATRADHKRRVKYGDKFVDVYNDHFTHREQRQIGNIQYSLNNDMKDPRNEGECTYTDLKTKEDRKDWNPRHERITMINIRNNRKKDPATIVHELIHAKLFMRGIHGSKQNEKKVDFETVGRLKTSGLLKKDSGYYYSRKEGNRNLPNRRDPQRDRISFRGMLHDRILLTGSIKKNIIGKPVERRVDNRFRQSFFFKRNMSLFRDNGK